MKAGQARYSFICDERGLLIDDVLAYYLGDRYILVVNAANKKDVIDWLIKHKSKYPKVEITDMEKTRRLLSLQGPQSNKILQSIVANPGSISLQNFKYYTAKTVAPVGPTPPPQGAKY